jgi:Uma2 family endonuclease
VVLSHEKSKRVAQPASSLVDKSANMNRMATPTVHRPPPLTYEDYRLLPDDGKRYELMEGELFVSPAPATRHQTVSRRLQFALMNALETPGLAQIFNAPTDLLLAPTTVVQPDLIIIGTGRGSIITERAVEGVPDAVVEILSPTSLDRDQHIKRRLYQQFAIPEYWVVDPEHGMIVVHRIDQGTYGIRARYDRASILESPEFPTLRVPLLDLFR